MVLVQRFRRFVRPRRPFASPVSLSPLHTATGLGPVVFGYVAQIKGFRYVSWILLAVSGFFALILPFILDETRASVLLSRKAARLRKETGDMRYQSKDDFERGSVREMMKTSLGRPVQMLMREPVLIAITAWISFTWVRCRRPCRRRRSFRADLLNLLLRFSGRPLYVLLRSRGSRRLRYSVVSCERDPN